MLTVLKELNDDRKNTGFVIGEVPMGLSTDQTTVTNYLIDAVGSGLDGEDGLTSTDAYSAVFYPGAATMTALDGVGSIVVPMSALILRTFVLSDQNSELWFAPAGNARGVVDAIAIGYVDRANFNAFVRTGTPQGLRDLLYTNRVNPVTYFPQVGIINYGNHTRQANNTALDRINVARLTSYLRSKLEQTIRPFIFEPNDTITRNTVKHVCEGLLNDLVARRGIYDYVVRCDRSNNDNAQIDRNELHVDIAIEPVKSIEFIYIPIRIKATGQIASGNLTPAIALDK
jgi:phage tail sheath protein FI